MHDSGAIAETLREMMTQAGWRFTYNEAHRFFRFALTLRGVIRQAGCVIDVTDHGFTLSAVCPIGADPENRQIMTEAAEFVCRANAGLELGHFVLDCDSGELRFRLQVLCSDTLPTEGMLYDSLSCTMSVLERCGPGITAVLTGECSAGRALDRCVLDGLSAAEMYRIAAAAFGFDEDDGAPAPEDIRTDPFAKKGGNAE